MLNSTLNYFRPVILFSLAFLCLTAFVGCGLFNAGSSDGRNLIRIAPTTTQASCRQDVDPIEEYVKGLYLAYESNTSRPTTQEVKDNPFLSNLLPLLPDWLKDTSFLYSDEGKEAKKYFLALVYDPVSRGTWKYSCGEEEGIFKEGLEEVRKYDPDNSGYLNLEEIAQEHPDSKIACLYDKIKKAIKEEPSAKGLNISRFPTKYVWVFFVENITLARAINGIAR